MAAAQSFLGLGATAASQSGRLSEGQSYAKAVTHTKVSVAPEVLQIFPDHRRLSAGFLSLVGGLLEKTGPEGMKVCKGSLSSSCQ